MAVLVDAVAEFNNFGSESNPATFSFTVGDHPNRGLFVWAWVANEGNPATWTASYDGNAMTVLYTQANQDTLRGYRCWRLVGAGVTVGAHTLSIGLDASYTVSVHVVSLYDVDQSMPTGTVYVDEVPSPGGGESANITVPVNTTDGQILTFVLVAGGTAGLAATSPLILINIIGTGAGTYQGGVARRVGTGSSLVCQWTWTSAMTITSMAVNINAMGSLNVGHVSEPVIGGAIF